MIYGFAPFIWMALAALIVLVPGLALLFGRGGPRDASGRRVFRLAALLKAGFGLETQFANPDEHDREMAMVQGVTHMVARLVASLDERPTRMATRSYALLMQAVDMVRRDNPAVFDAIALRNPFVAGVQEQFFEAAVALRDDLAARRAALTDVEPPPCAAAF